jgi:hypothetical protein
MNVGKRAVEMSEGTAKQKPCWRWDEALPLAVKQLNAAIAEQLRILLETKHLYQSARIDFEKIVTEIREKVIFAYRLDFDNHVQQIPAQFTLTSINQSLVGRTGVEIPLLLLMPVNVKLFCEKCNRREAFKPIWYRDATNDLRKPNYEEAITQLPATFQLFFLVYQCQSCQGVPEALLVRRQGWQLSLHGRSPIEHIEIPAYIPKIEGHWFRDATIALHGGKTLAALFYLRTFVEQFARRQTKLTGRKTGDEIMSAYGDILPLKQRDFMPSLREWYEKLSEAVHEAREDGALFEDARKEIERHFEFRKAFGIPETVPAAKDKQL